MPNAERRTPNVGLFQQPECVLLRLNRCTRPTALNSDTNSPRAR